MHDKTAATVLKTLMTWCATTKIKGVTLHPGFLTDIRTDADSVFMSEEFRNGCLLIGVDVTHAAPRHQEMNGLAERSWRSIRDLAFSMMVHAHVGDEFYDFALDQA